MLYETTITELFPDPAKLVVGGLHDRGYIYVDNRPKGILSRGENCMDMPLSVRSEQWYSAAEFACFCTVECRFSKLPRRKVHLIGHIHKVSQPP